MFVDSGKYQSVNAKPVVDLADLTQRKVSGLSQDAPLTRAHVQDVCEKSHSGSGSP